MLNCGENISIIIMEVDYKGVINKDDAKLVIFFDKFLFALK